MTQSVASDRDKPINFATHETVRSFPREFIWILALICVTELIAVFMGSHFELTDQEAYYWTWARHLSFGYYEHPPLLAWITALFIHLFGNAAWVVRLPAFLGRLIGLCAFSRAACQSLPAKSAFLVCLLVLSTPAMLMGSMISIPDVLAVPLGLLALLAAQKGQAGRAGLFCGLALLAKWTMLFILPGLVFLLRAQQTSSRPLRQIGIFLSIVGALQIPVIYWNSQHGWATFVFQSFARHEKHLLLWSEYFKNAGALIGSQIFCFGILFSGLFLMLTFRHPRLLTKSFLVMILPTLLIVFASGVQGQLRYYWGCFLIFPVAWWIGSQTTHWSLKNQNLLGAALVFNVLIMWLLTVVAVLEPVGPVFDRWTQQAFHYRHSPQGEIRGWAEWLDYMLDKEKIDLSKTNFYTTDFRLAAQVEWSLARRTEKTSLSPGLVTDLVGTLAPFEDRNEYQFRRTPPNRPLAVFVADDRYDKVAPLEKACRHPMSWNSYFVYLEKTPIKEIRWGYCRALVAPKSHFPLTAFDSKN